MEDIKKFNRKRALVAMIMSGTIVVFFFIALMVRLFEETDPALNNSGLGAYHMFTIDSNLLLSIAVSLTIPYQIDGFRNNNLHLPRWVDIVLYVATSCTTLTSLVTIFVLSPFAGYREMLIEGSNLIYHLINPILALILFIVVLSDHNIKFAYNFLTLIPVVTYSEVYAIVVFGIGVEKGGWADHYQVASHMPWPLAIVLVILVSFTIGLAVRVLHNSSHKKLKERNKKAYQDYFCNQYPTIKEAVVALAQADKVHDPKNNEITVPRRIIAMLEERYQSGIDMSKLAETYVHEYLSKKETKTK